MTLFENESYAVGDDDATLGTGTYSALALGELNNNIESIQVPVGMSVILCSDSLGQENCQVFTTDTSPLPAELLNNVSFVQINIQAPTAVGLSSASTKQLPMNLIVWALLIAGLGVSVLWVKIAGRKAM